MILVVMRRNVLESLTFFMRLEKDDHFHLHFLTFFCFGGGRVKREDYNPPRGGDSRHNVFAVARADQALAVNYSKDMLMEQCYHSSRQRRMPP